MQAGGHSSTQTPQPLQYSIWISGTFCVNSTQASGQNFQQIRQPVQRAGSMIGRRLRQLPVRFSAMERSETMTFGVPGASSSSRGMVCLSAVFVGPARRLHVLFGLLRDAGADGRFQGGTIGKARDGGQGPANGGSDDGACGPAPAAE